IHYISDNQPANEKSDDSQQGAELQVSKAANRMSRGTAAGIAGSEANQESAGNHYDEALQAGQISPAKQVFGHHPGKVTDTKRRQFGNRLCRKLHGIMITQQPSSDKAPQYRATDKYQIPAAGFLPVVLEKFDLARHTGRTGMAQVRGYAKLLAAN